ncbi:hypothetical protein JYU22_05355, partial [Gammaproteobacteria bacterium AH-315-E17]|nr:hypothetical protein [Gammaproteobacteria bacterium AH-315-E17]
MFDVSTEVMEEREPRLDPNESVLGDALRPLLNNGDYQASALLMETAIADGAVLSPALQHILGQVYMALQDNSNAKQAFLNAIDVMPNFTRAHQRLGLIYLQEQAYDNARTHLSKTIELGAADAETYGQLAFANLQDYSAWSAINGYQQALLLEPDNQQWQQGLLFSLISAKHFPAAQALIDEMLSKDQDNRELWLQSSNIALNNDAPLSALTRLEIALKMGASSENDAANQI